MTLSRFNVGENAIGMYVGKIGDCVFEKWNPRKEKAERKKGKEG